MTSSPIPAIETFVQTVFDTSAKSPLLIAHTFHHCDRVRRWALQIAQHEGYAATNVVEATALLHDIGLCYVTERRHHASVGAEKAMQFLRTQAFFTETQMSEIGDAIAIHSSLEHGSLLANILRDADMLDLFGALGIMRACMSQYSTVEYHPAHPKGIAWNMQPAYFTQRFREGKGAGDTVLDYIHFHISCFDNLYTATARHFAEPLIDFMKMYIQHVHNEATH